MKESPREIKKAVEQLGNQLGAEKGKEFEKVATSALAQKMIPRNLLGMNDALVEGIYGQAYRLYNTGKYKDASQLFRLLIMIDPTESKFLMGLAASFHMMKDYKNAVNVYSLCGIIDPNSPVPHYHASDCYLHMEDPISAIISLEMAIKRAGEKPEFQALKDRAKLTIDSLKKRQKHSETTS